METKEVRKRSVEVVKQLREVGIKAMAPKQNRAGDDIFLIDREENGRIRLWAGIAKIEVKGDKTHKQAVVNVTEDKRTITEQVEAMFRSDSHIHPDVGKNNDKVASSVRQRFIDGFSIELPDTAKFRVSGIRKQPNQEEGNTYETYVATVTATVPASTIAFLVGKDEHSQFISALPKQAKSVTDAHDILRPKGVSKDAPRQGEWFFKPVSDKIRAELDRLVELRPGRVLYDEADPLCNEETTHHAHQLELKGKYYAIGWVVDVRNSGYMRRHSAADSRHVPLLLHDWHEVIRNNEVPNRNDDQSWD